MGGDEAEPGDDARTRPRPTVIGDARERGAVSDRKAGTPGPLAPTVIVRKAPPAPKRPPPATSETPGPPIPRFGPTAIRGTERRRIPVSAQDLLRLSPLAVRQVVDDALRAIATFVPETAGERQVVLWGHEAQRRHAALVSRAVELSQAPVLSRTREHLQRMCELLAAVDVEAICGLGPREGLLDRLFGRARSAIATPAELEEALAEIAQLRTLTDAALEDLLSLRRSLERHGEEVRAVERAIEATALAATFLSEHLREERETLSRGLLERAASLTRTLAQSRGGASVAAVQADQPLRLVAAIQDAMLVALPDLLASLAALAVALREGGRRPNPTEAGELAFRLRDVLQRTMPRGETR